MFKLYISEILDKVKKSSSDADKAKLLKDNSSIPLQQILFANFNPNIKFLLPPGPTPYKPSKFDVGLGDNSLMKEFRKLYLFYQGGHKTLQQARREQLWIQLLEGMSSSEAKVLESLKDKQFERDYGVTRECVDLAFPRLLERIPKVSVPKVEVIQPTEEKKEESSVQETPVEEKPKKKRAKKVKKQEVIDESPSGTDVQS